MKKIIILTLLLFNLTVVFGQYSITPQKVRNAIDSYIDLGSRINSCKDRCDFDYYDRVKTTFSYSMAQDYANTKERQVAAAAIAAESSSFKTMACDCSNFAKPDLSLDANEQREQQNSETKAKALTDAGKTYY